MRTTLVFRLAGSFIALLPAVKLAGQTTGTVIGTITTVSGTPIARARIAVVGTPLATVAAVDGGFRLPSVPTTAQTLDVKMLGYKPRLFAIDVLGGETLHVAIVLAANPLLLDTVAVISDAAVTPGIRGFEERRSRGPGVFFRRDDIERMQPRVLTDVLRRVPGLQIRPVRGGLGNNVSVQARGSDCPMLFYMNGSAFSLPPDQPINDFVAPEEVVALEIYSGSSEIPVQFSHNNRCGVIMVWTRYGPEISRRR
jgi:hypothetical protein